MTNSKQTYSIFLSVMLLLGVTCISTDLDAANKNLSAHSLTYSESTPQNYFYNYVDSLLSREPLSTESLIELSDSIIESMEDSISQAAAAGFIFNKYSNSDIIGQEAVAIHVAKKYFLSKKLQWQGEGGLSLLRLYTEFNENSLTGMKAPELELNTLSGKTISLSSLKSRYTIVYFYDINCTSCRMMLPGLKSIVKKYKHLSPEVYAVFTRQDTADLNRFIQSEFTGTETRSWHFVYDAEAQSNYHKLYNVLSTPRIFLLDREKTIIGRLLDNSSLNQLLESEQKKLSRSYDLAQGFTEQYLSLFNLEDSSELRDALNPLKTRLIAENKDMYNAVFHALFHLFSSHEEQYMKNAAATIAQDYILAHKNLWYDTTFINNTIPATIKKIESNKPGSRFPETTLYDKRNRKKSIAKIRSRYTYIYFFNPDCAICKPFTFELKKIYKELRKKRVKIVAIYTGSDINELKEYLNKESPPWKVLYPGPSGEITLYNTYEISYIPQTYLLNRDKEIISKGINTIMLKQYLK